jgi:uncharacterized protein (DUF488 family)
MERKVRDSHGSLMVALPKQMAQAHEISEGATVSFRETAEGILLVPKPQQQILWTVGYEGESPESFAKLLTDRKIKSLVDIRDLPLSRRRGFSKTKLGELLADNKIIYYHLKPLGAPKEIRHPYLAGGSFSDFMVNYNSHLKDQTEAVQHLVDLAQEGNTAIMCVEHLHSICHRQFVAAELSKQGFEIRHI